MDLRLFEKNLVGRRILLTGHTGFTGTWVQIWLNSIGVECVGLSLENTDSLSLRGQTGVRPKIEVIGDIADSSLVFNVFKQVQPELVLHLAAQPIVSLAYTDTFKTITSNAQGTAVILEACMRTSSVQNVVCVTTDKVYKNLETRHKFVESDELGGGDPYSSSKSAAEHIIIAYSQTIKQLNRKINLHVARGGNIVGGGDYSKDRIVPDLVRSILDNTPILVRQPNSTRPWQHVLSIIHGYLMLLTKELNEFESERYSVWNFGPSNGKELKVADIVQLFENQWKKPRVDYIDGPFKESHNLQIDSRKANINLGWSPKWNNEEIFSQTINWYRKVHEESQDALIVSEKQIAHYRELNFS